QVDVALEARSYFAWGRTIPEDIFRHFVLVYRVNNEYLDSARSVFFAELKERVKPLSMGDAALEVNHWCHEKATYRSTDGRTSAPLAMVRTAWGRCGEESVLTVTALRAVGIPARQCYTPRWVHTNDNHAWVEVWVDGRWRYMGACEPEPALDAAWFTAPAKRAMMVHTNVVGPYSGDEEKNVQQPLYSTLNVLATYAATRRISARIVDAQGQPVEGATVLFKVFNYAELYPIVSSLSNARGEASIISGMGDVVVWARSENAFGYAKFGATDSTLTIALNRNAGAEYSEDYVMNVPPEQRIDKLPDELVAANNIRLAHEDSIRNAYMQQAYVGGNAEAIPSWSQSAAHREKMMQLLRDAQGNWREIARFIVDNKDAPLLFPFLASLTKKDLRDTPADVLQNHFRNGRKSADIPDDIYASKVLSPRISRELIQPWRSYFQQPAIANAIAGEAHSVDSIIRFVAQNIELRDADNYYNNLLMPQGVYELRMADRRSRDVFFVAACRSLGFAAQLEESTGKPQYYERGQWLNAYFEPEDSAQQTIPSRTPLLLSGDASNLVSPSYSSSYTIAVFRNGDFHTLNLESNPAASRLPFRTLLDDGYYRLMTGSRSSDGSVAVGVQYFNLSGGKQRELTLRLPTVKDKLQLMGSLDPNTLVTLQNGDKKSLKELDNGKGIMLCFVDVGKEPSKHILQDLPAQQKELEEWGGGILLITPDDRLSKAFSADAFAKLPSQTSWAIDHNRSLLNAATAALNMDFADDFPFTLYLTTSGGILYATTGYRIGIGEEIMRVVGREN
ncbi:MAG: transglutaminase-like domain-containing protein, partial [Prevotellaceae bacterium]|nr:transglutaminase-like domain-containing protein [Prevotellaceae bacterium]